MKKTIPQFWYSTDEGEKSPLLSSLLWPISQLYRLGTGINKGITRTRKSPLPVICIGNMTMGGAGKTPMARAVLKLVQDHGKFQTTCFLMRGYGGRQKGPIEVDPLIHTSWDVGDEALMQAEYAPVIVSRDRYDGAKLAQSLGYDLIIMDDGFQNPQLKKDLSLVVVDGGFGFGNGMVFPSGPLRETLQSGLSRANAAIVINRTDNIDLTPIKRLTHFDGKIILNNNYHDNENKHVVAFAGIARPEKFFQTLEDNGYKIHAHIAFGDHHIFTHGQLNAIVDRAKKANAGIITTEKDWIRLSDKWQKQISCLKISIELGDDFKSYLFKKLDTLSA
jgi:tetraacyldisaccharide 4'-kinase